MLRTLHFTLLFAALSLATLAARWQAQPLTPAEVGSPGRQNAYPASLRRAGIPGPLAAQVIRIVDGDTFEARVRIWFGQEITTLVRLRDMDAPELNSHCPKEAEGAKAAAAALEEFLATGPVQLADIAMDKYGGRVVATAYVLDRAAPAALPENISSLMLASGLARAYGGGRRASWCEQAEKGR